MLEALIDHGRSCPARAVKVIAGQHIDPHHAGSECSVGKIPAEDRIRRTGAFQACRSSRRDQGEEAHLIGVGIKAVYQRLERVGQ